MYHMLRCTNMYYHIIARTSVYFTLLHTLYIFSDCNALNIQFWTCNRDVNNSSNLSDISILGIIVFRRLDLSGPSICSNVTPDFWIHSCVYQIFTVFWSVILFVLSFVLSSERLVFTILSTSKANGVFTGSLTVPSDS